MCDIGVTWMYSALQGIGGNTHSMVIRDNMASNCQDVHYFGTKRSILVGSENAATCSLYNVENLHLPLRYRFKHNPH